MKIGAFTFDDPVFLAPMAGVTDTAYRVIAHDMGCPLAFAEMVSSQGIHYRNEHTMKMLRTEEGERPIAMQIFAKSASMAAEAAAYIEAIGTADILDFNMGCPAPKVVKNGEGSALMREPKKAEEILTAVRRATKLPFTVKMRLGWDDASRNAVEIARIAEGAGVDAVAVHVGGVPVGDLGGHAEPELTTLLDLVVLHLLHGGGGGGDGVPRRGGLLGAGGQGEEGGGGGSSTEEETAVDHHGVSDFPEFCKEGHNPYYIFIRYMREIFHMLDTGRPASRPRSHRGRRCGSA